MTTPSPDEKGWSLRLKVLLNPPGPPYLAVRSSEFKASKWPNAADGAIIGTAADQNDKKTPVWLEPADEGKEEGISPSLVRFFDRGWQTRQYSVTARTPICRKWAHGVSGDIDLADRVQVPTVGRDRFSDWALLVTSEISGPVRVVVREHVDEGTVRLFYATRVLWGLQKNAQLEVDKPQHNSTGIYEADQIKKETQPIWLQRLEPDAQSNKVF